MRTITWLYLGSVFATAAILAVPALADYQSITSNMHLATLAVLIVLATLAQMFKAEGPNHAAFYATTVFLFAGVLLVPPAGIVLLAVVPHCIEWAITLLMRKGGKHLKHWYIQPFNISMHTVAGLSAYWTIAAITDWTNQIPFISPVSAMVAGVVVYLMVGQLLLGQAFVLARSLTWRESRILTVDNLLPEFLLMCMGIGIAVLWNVDPWLLLPGLAPLVLMYRALLVPKLKEEAQTDGKTGLYNARHFNRRVNEELERAQRFNRPFAFIMADLDLLREINNTYGHLAGDAVLEGIGRIIRNSVRDYDIAGRFGGEEFAIAIPEATREQAVALAERIRQTISEAGFVVSTHPTPIRATMSLGIACYPDDAQTLTDLQHEADVAVYQAKFQGRNRVICADQVPHSFKLEHMQNGQQTILPEVIMPVQPAPAEPHVAPAPPAVAPAPVTALKANIPPQPAAPPRHPEPAPPSNPRRKLTLGTLIIAVFAAGCVTMLTSLGTATELDLLALMLFVGLAALAELLQISVYEDNSMSVSLAAIVAAALVGGMPAAALVSLTIAVVNQVRRGRINIEIYKVGFNWATHVLAVAPLALAPITLAIPLNIEQFMTLIGVTAVASVVYYAVDSTLISAAISMSRGGDLFRTWRTQFRWLAVHYIILALIGLFLALAYIGMGAIGVLVFTLPVFMLRYAQQQYVSRTRDSVRELRRLNTELSQANQEITSANIAIRQLNEELLEMLARVFDARDPYTGSHSAKVADYAGAIAREINLPPEEIQLVRQAGLLHDIGKIAIPEQILNKAGPLTAEEYEWVKQHVITGAALLENSRGLRHLAPIVRHHHERWDGKGYPHGLRAYEIPQTARILALCDAVEAMLSDRPYQRGRSLEETISELRRCSGTQFDPELVSAFIRVAQREGATLIQNSSLTANHQMHHRAMELAVNTMR